MAHYVCYIVIKKFSLTDLVVEAWAMIFPPIGFLGSAVNIDAPSTCATTWLVITTATPNYIIKQIEIIHTRKDGYF